MTVDPPAVAEVLAQLQRHIETDLAPQDRLEDERTLAQRYGRSRQTVRRALARLEAQGMIWRHVGKGAFAGPRPAGVRAAPRILAEQATPRDIMEARLLIEPGLAALAAERISSDQVERLRILSRLTASARDWREYEAADDELHRLIAHLSGNLLAVAFFEVLSDVRRRVRWQRQHDRAFRSPLAGDYPREQGAMHHAVIDAIAAGDARGAQQAMRDHLMAITRLMTED